MRLTFGIACVLLAAVACTGASDPSPDATPARQTTSTVADGPIRGALPDGTVYDVILDPPAHERPTAVSAGVVVDGKAVEVEFERSADRWSAQVGSEPLEVTTHLGLPVIELPSRLRWADDDQVSMQVTYETFAVRRGCDEEAAACNPTQAVQALPRQGWSGAEATMISYALRRPTHPGYVDPGPLEGQSGHDVLWTGEEMIVWGGNAPPRVEGAAYDPKVREWRNLPAAPLEERQPTRAVWTGEEMIVLAEEGTLAYHPGRDAWRRAGEGIRPPSEPGAAIWAGKQVVAWTEAGIRGLDPDTGEWTDLGRVDMPPRCAAVGGWPGLCDRVGRL